MKLVNSRCSAVRNCVLCNLSGIDVGKIKEVGELDIGIKELRTEFY